jgi:hypothetical protein
MKPIRAILLSYFPALSLLTQAYAILLEPLPS